MSVIALLFVVSCFCCHYLWPLAAWLKQKLHKVLGDLGSDAVQRPLTYGSHRSGNARLTGVSGPALWHEDVRLQ